MSAIKKIKNIDVTKIDINRVIFLTKKLIEILNYETAILDKMEINEYNKIFQEKGKYIDELDIHQKIIEKKPHLLNEIQPEKINELKDLQMPFEQAKENNMKRLKKAIFINQYVADSVKKALNKKINGSHGYSKNGDYAAQCKMEKEMPPLSLNNVI